MIGMLMKPTSVMMAAARAACRIVDGAGQRDDAEIHQEQHEDRGEASVPHPPCAPHRLAPDRAGDQRERGKDRADGAAAFNATSASGWRHTNVPSAASAMIV